MTFRSLGYATDIAILQLGGSEVTDEGDALIVRSPHSPTFWWGNFLLLDRAPEHGSASAWVDRFHHAFPTSRHIAIGINETRADDDTLQGFRDLGLEVEYSTVMTTQAVTPPARINSAAIYRPLVSEDDWAQSVDVRCACNDMGLEPVSYRAYVSDKTASNRRLMAAGHGQWFGAFVDGRLACQMGLFRAGEGLARFQSVETHPDFRRQGLAANLVFTVSRFGLDELRASTLVMVADPDYFAIDLYRSVGFSDTETQFHISRRPPEDVVSDS